MHLRLSDSAMHQHMSKIEEKRTEVNEQEEMFTGENLSVQLSKKEDGTSEIEIKGLQNFEIEDLTAIAAKIAEVVKEKEGVGMDEMPMGDAPVGGMGAGMDAELDIEAEVDPMGPEGDGPDINGLPAEEDVILDDEVVMDSIVKEGTKVDEDAKIEEEFENIPDGVDDDEVVSDEVVSDEGEEVSNVEEIATSFINGNLGWVKKQIGSDIGLAMEVITFLAEISPDEVTSFKSLFTA